MKQSAFSSDVLEHEPNTTMSVMGSSEDMTWATPQQWFDYLDLEFKFTLDPCCTKETAKCDMFYTPETDGLAHSWNGYRVFMNPPYGSEIGRWMRKAYEECRNNGVLVVCFVPARVDTEWWHEYAEKASDIRFPKGRVRFAGAEASAPFPVAIVIFRPRVDGGMRIINALRDMLRIVETNDGCGLRCPDPVKDRTIVDEAKAALLEAMNRTTSTRTAAK